MIIKANLRHRQFHHYASWNNGWLLSPAYDLNPVPYAQCLQLNITDSDNRLDFRLAFNVANFFQLTPKQANDEIYQDVIESVKHCKQWQPKLALVEQSRNE